VKTEKTLSSTKDTKDLEIDILESLNFVLFVTSSFESWSGRLAADRPGDLSQCHSEEPFGDAQDKLRAEESVVICFEGVKNIKQILHCVQDDGQC
jgi:hypothetical protein